MDGISSSITTFKHEPLPDAMNHIRLLEVFDDNYSDTIKVSCRITTWPTDDMPTYYAVSYAWGDSKSNETILINDKDFQVRTNCEFVLKQVCYYARSCYYWIDAICIDQENLDEKSKQVAMMGNIYEKADHVLACIGDHTDDSRFLFRHFKQFSITMHEPWFDHKSLYRKYGYLTTRRFAHASFDFAKRPYFSRLWILQELKNAKQASLLCGTDAVPKDEFGTVLERLLYYFYMAPQKPLWKLVSFLLRPGDNEMQQRIWDALDVLSPGVSPLNLVKVTTRLQCTIPKDKVYGIISLIESGGGGSIIPDYTKSDFEVAVDLFRALQNTEGVRLASDSEPVCLCLTVISNLKVSRFESEGVAEALEAREACNGPPPRTSIAAESWLLDPLPRARVTAFGWRISAGDLSQDHARFSSWNPPGPNPSTIYVPYWAGEGDWIICWSTRHGAVLLVLREEVDSLGMPVVGHAWSESSHSSHLGVDAFEIRWNPEDALIFTITRLVLTREEKRSNRWVEALNKGICKRRTPGSSYGVKIQQ